MNKTESLDKFTELVRDQFVYGGKKYAEAGSTTRETTDILFDEHGKGWLFGTIDKYTYRFLNVRREKDLLKIACYMYILWLKRGFFVAPHGVNDPPLNTTVAIKEQHFDTFVQQAREYYQQYATIKKQWPTDGTPETKLQWVSQTLKDFSKREWGAVDPLELLLIFLLTFLVWDELFFQTQQAGKDTDTWIETKAQNAVAK